MTNHVRHGIRYEIRDGIGCITLDRPEVRNAFTLEMIDEWIEILKRADSDPAVRVIVLTGEGSSFCSGADLKEIFEEDETPFIARIGSRTTFSRSACSPAASTSP